MKWQDTSSYSRSDTDRRQREATLDTGPLRIVVHHHRDFEPDDWLVSARPGLLERHLVGKGTIEEAEAAAIRIVRAKLASLSKALESAVESGK